MKNAFEDAVKAPGTFIRAIRYDAPTHMYFVTLALGKTVRVAGEQIEETTKRCK